MYRVIVILEGGNVARVLTDDPNHKVMVIDYDAEDADPRVVHQVPQDKLVNGVVEFEEAVVYQPYVECCPDVVIDLMGRFKSIVGG